MKDESKVDVIREKCYDYAKEHTIQSEIEKMWKYVFSKL